MGGSCRGRQRRTVAQTAEACGFSDPLYFSRAFRRRVGVSPRTFRRKGGHVIP
ncbi:MAG: AraC family transcriptional regulator [Kiritimatiellae bacterium]|nr:AraC family transcriptional regulator [Kiritimatiellia bacterium]